MGNCERGFVVFVNLFQYFCTYLLFMDDLTHIYAAPESQLRRNTKDFRRIRSGIKTAKFIFRCNMVALTFVTFFQLPFYLFLLILKLSNLI